MKSRIFLAALCLAAPLTASAWGEAAWGYSDDFLHSSIESDMIWRSTRQMQESGKSKNKSDDEPARSPLDLGDVGNLAGSHGRQLSDVSTAEMLAARLCERSDFLDRSHMFQQLIINFNLEGLGMWLFALRQELQKQPDAQEKARIRKMAADLLQNLAGAKPEQISFSSSGMRIAQ